MLQTLKETLSEEWVEGNGTLCTKVGPLVPTKRDRV